MVRTTHHTPLATCKTLDPGTLESRNPMNLG